eukprot:TRINITY_DN2859_c0_g1_i1.p1 TRINITY_DN2859_c0_g1~~TRINITY_DN2859_c0_g1_i1.p1  ORF type:complete len:2291 (+),score=488.31 TRINITY_DN2859_c0_g1_i1:743-6874(+)
MTIGSQSSTVITLTPSSIAYAGTVPVLLNATSYGTSMKLYTFNPQPVLSSVDAAVGPVTGGRTITAIGTNLGSGSDIVSVTICGAAMTLGVQSATHIVLQTPACAAGSYTITITSTSFGTATLVNGFQYLNPGTISAATPSSARQSGGVTVTITGTLLGDGSDITAVSLGGVSVSSISAQTTSSVTVVCGVGSSASSGVLVVSSSRGNVTTGGVFSYYPLGVVTSVAPTAGKHQNAVVTITASNSLGSGTDITTVTFFGVAASINSQTAQTVTVTTASHAAGLCSITIVSTLIGTSVATNSYTYYAQPVIDFVTPGSGPIAGGNMVTIVGSTDLCSGSDVTAVTVCGIPATVFSMTTTEVVVTVADGTSASGVLLVVESTSRGTSQCSNCYLYNAAGSLTGAVPNTVRLTGGGAVTISASVQISSGSDITEVTLKGVQATIIGQTTTTVTVIPGDASPTGGTGNIVVRSTGFGEVTQVNGFTYFPKPIITAVTPSNGPAAGGYTVTITSSPPLGSSGADITFVSIRGVAVTVLSATATTITITMPAALSGAGVIMANSSTRGYATASFTHNALPVISGCNPTNGPQVGGRTVTTVGSAQLGSGSDITLVTVNGNAATVVSQTTSSVIVTTPAGAAGAVTVQTVSTSFGIATLNSAYTYNTLPSIGSISPSSGPLAGRTVTIFGSLLGAGGSDITSVIVCGTAATILGQTSTTLTVTLGAGAVGIVGDVTISTVLYGSGTLSNAYTYVDAGQIASAAPDSKQGGGVTVTITCIPGKPIGNGADITQVRLGGVAVNSITSQTTSSVTVVSAATTSGVTTGVEVDSTLYGLTTASFWSYMVTGTIISVVPASIPSAGGFTVTISSSTDFSTANDVTSVSLCNVICTIVSQTARVVVVQVPPGPSGVQGNVLISSTSLGAATGGTNRFTFNAPMSITSVDPSAAPRLGGKLITIVASAGLGSVSDVTEVTLAGVTATIFSQTSTSVTVRTNAAAVTGWQTVVVRSTSFGSGQLANAVMLTSPGSITAIVPSDGPLTGNQTVTISGTALGNGADISSVTIFNAAADILSQTATSITVRSAGILLPGLGAAVVDSQSQGLLTRSNAFTYRPAPLIASFVPLLIPRTGARLTIYGLNVIGSGSDITEVLVADDAATIVAQSSTVVVVQTALRETPITGSVVVRSRAYGRSEAPALITVNPRIVFTLNATALKEGDAAVWFDVSLDTAPTATVTIPMSVVAFAASYFAQAKILSHAVFVFNNTNWNVTQGGWLAAEDNYIAEGNVDCGIAFGPGVSADSFFHNIALTPAVLCTDNDFVGIKTTFLDFEHVLGGIVEGGYPALDEDTSRTLALSLSSQPLGDVTVRFVNPLDLVVGAAVRFMELVPSLVTLTWTPQTWNVSHNVTFVCPNDQVILPIRFYSFVFQPLTNNDLQYSAWFAANQYPVLYVDDDLQSHVFVYQPGVNDIAGNEGVNSTIYVVLIKALTPGSFLNEYLSYNDTSRVALVDPLHMQILPSDLRISRPLVVSVAENDVDDGTASVLLSLRSVLNDNGEITESIGTSPISIRNNDFANFNLSVTDLQVNETGSTATFTVVPTTRLVQPITVTITSADVGEVRVLSPNTLAFDATNWRSPQQVTVQGVRDNVRDGNRTVRVWVAGRSVDPAYNAVNVSVNVTNFDIYWPALAEVTPPDRPVRPYTFAQFGQNATAIGFDFLPGMRVFVNEMETIVTMLSDGFVAFTTDTINATGYQNLTFVNPDGGWTLFTKMVFYTDTCPNQGEYGNGLTCYPCPPGAFCPGGYRLWPLPGWWSASEESAEVVPCSPRRCRGGLGSPCNDTYAGARCADCVVDYYAADDECLQCSGPSEITYLLFCQFAFLGLFMFATIVSSEKALNNVQFLLQGMRVVWVTASGSASTPPAGQGFYNALKLFAGDFDFVKPGCIASGITTFNAEFAINMTVVLGITIPLVLILFVLYSLRKVRATLGVPLKERVMMIAAYNEQMKGHMARAVIAIFLFGYEIVTVTALESLFCRWQGESYWLVSGISQVRTFRFRCST